MKRKRCFVMLTSLFMILIAPNTINAEQNKIDDQLMSDTLLTLLDPYISKEIEEYYGYPKQSPLYNTKVLDISREDEGQFTFKVKVQVKTFEAAHNPPYGKETIKLGVSGDEVKVLHFNHKGDEWERKRTNFYDEAISDIRKTFQLNLDAFKKINYEQLSYKAENQKAYKTLLNIVDGIMDSELNPDIKPPYKNVIEPVTFIKRNQGYILYKKADGTNIVIQVSKENGKWRVVKKERKQGKQMKNDLLWYM